MFSERIKIIIKTLGIKNKEFAKELGLTQGGLSDIINGRVKKLSGTFIELLKLKYNVNPTWLLTGEGEMFLPGKKPPVKAENGLEVINGTVESHPELDILPKIAYTGWWDKLTETEREIIVFMANLKDPQTKQQIRDLLEACLKKELTEEELLKKIEGLDDPQLKQKGAAG